MDLRPLSLDQQRAHVCNADTAHYIKHCDLGSKFLQYPVPQHQRDQEIHPISKSASAVSVSVIVITSARAIFRADASTVMLLFSSTVSARSRSADGVNALAWEALQRAGPSLQRQSGSTLLRHDVILRLRSDCMRLLWQARSYSHPLRSSFLVESCGFLVRQLADIVAWILLPSCTLDHRVQSLYIEDRLFSRSWRTRNQNHPAR
jgi:hypothetical protein